MRIPGFGEIPRGRRVVLLILIALIVVTVAQVRWWMFDQARHAAEVEQQLVEVAAGRLVVDEQVISSVRERQARRANQYAWEGAFFVVVLCACLAAVWRDLRSDDAARRRQETFLALVSHQFKTPLASLRLAVETLTMRRASPEHIDHLAWRALEEVQRLEDLIANILETARLDDGRVALRREPLPLARLVSQATDRLAERAERHKVKLRVDVGAGAVVLADPVATDAILRNVLENAIASVTPLGGGHVEVSSREAEGIVELTVRDTGVGFDPADAPRLFEKFGFAELAYRGGERTGLGLYIVRRLMEIGGGSVRAESDGLGQGARFIMTWPRVTEESP
jgi:signal transduction histidine kinase